MYPLGHLTVACATVWAGARALERAPPAAVVSGISRLARRIDYRLVMLGALLPDLIDKPIGWIIFRDHFDGSDHLYGHTLLAALAVLLPGIALLLRRRDPRLFAVGVAMLSHFLVDPVNHSPQTLLWPLLGTDFPHLEALVSGVSRPAELPAGIIILTVAWWLWRRGRFWTFVSEGRS